MYRYAKIKDKVTEEPASGYDHTMDAIRYAVTFINDNLVPLPKTNAKISVKRQ